MKTPSTELFDLIKSMSRNEKGYFKKYCARHLGEKNNNALLFDAIDNQKEYYELDIVKKFKKTNIAKKFSVYKGFLHKTLLESLRSYYSERSIDLEIYEQLQYVIILFNKGFYKTCLKSLKKLKTKAEKYELYELNLEILRWESIVTSYLPEALTLKTTDKRAENIKKIEQLNEYEKLRTKLVLIVLKQFQSKNKQSKEDVNHILKQLHRQFELLPLRIKIASLNAQNIATRFLNEESKAYELNIQAKMLFEKNEAYLKEFPLLYASVVTNLVSTCLLQNKALEAKKHTTVFNTFYNKFENTKKINSFQLSYSLTVINTQVVNMLCGQGAFDELEDMISVVETNGSLFQGTISKAGAVIMAYIMAKANFYKGDYSQALTYIDQVVKFSDIRLDIQHSARLLEVITHYELENGLYLEHLIRNSKRFFKQRNLLTPLDNAIFQFFKKNILKVDKRAEKKALGELSAAIEDSTNKEYVEQFDFDLYTWVQSKHQSISFRDALQKSNKK